MQTGDDVLFATLARRALAALALLPLAAPAMAQDYPNRPVTLIAGAAPGGPTDIISRIVAEAMARHMPQPVVVENSAPAHVGAQRVAQARPDGYTLLVTNVGMAAGATLFRRLSYDIATAFAPLGLVSDAAMTLMARPGFQATDLAGYVAAVRTQGEALNLGTAGLGSAANLCGLLLQQAAGARVTIVAFRGTGPAIAELLAGRIDLLCDQATNTIPFLRDNRLTAYGVTSPARLRDLPAIPTVAEAGYPTMGMSTWHGLYAPAGTPQDVQDRINQALQAAMLDERLRARYADLVTDPATPERASIAFHRRFHQEEIDRWRPIIRAAGAYAD